MTKAILDTINKKTTQRYPIWFLRQAGRYLPEYMEIRKSMSFLELCENPKLAAEVTLQPLKRFDLDAAIIFADILLILRTLGQELTFAKDHGPMLTPAIRCEKDFLSLQKNSFDVSQLHFVGDAIAHVKAQLAPHVSLIGFAGAPCTVASYMIEGSGSKNFMHLKKLIYQTPKLFLDILDLLCESTFEYLKMQSLAGCDLLMLFDTWAGQIPSYLYKELVWPKTCKLMARLKQLGKAIIYYPGQNPHHLLHMDFGVMDVLHLDWRFDLKTCLKSIEPQKTLPVIQGNLDPQALFLKEDHLRSLVRNRISEFCETAPCGHIFNVGHGLTPQTPIQALHWVVDEIRKFRPNPL